MHWTVEIDCGASKHLIETLHAFVVVGGLSYQQEIILFYQLFQQ
jgi:hypothetical protein